jgi:hypothetical protein
VVRRRLRNLFLALAVLAVIATVAKRVYDWDHQLKAEYVTAGVIRDVTKFAESHKGQWPQSWDDIPEGNFARQYVRMRFDVKIDELVADPILIQSAIVPVSGAYYTYPHAERKLNELRDVLVRFHKP